MLKLRKVFLLFILFFVVSGFSQEKTPADSTKKKDAYQFTDDYKVAYTPVKSQARTGTCWCFSTVSMLESELLRMGKKEMDLSEMFIVRKTYPLKAESYIRLHGNTTFGEGAYSHDVINQMRRYGMVPESAYSGMNIGEKKHNHSEVSRVLTAMLDAVKKGRKLTPRWEEAFDDVLDASSKGDEASNNRSTLRPPITLRPSFMGTHTKEILDLSIRLLAFVLSRKRGSSSMTGTAIGRPDSMTRPVMPSPNLYRPLVFSLCEILWATSMWISELLGFSRVMEPLFMPRCSDNRSRTL